MIFAEQLIYLQGIFFFLDLMINSVQYEAFSSNKLFENFLQRNRNKDRRASFLQRSNWRSDLSVCWAIIFKWRINLSLRDLDLFDQCFTECRLGYLDCLAACDSNTCDDQCRLGFEGLLMLIQTFKLITRLWEFLCLRWKLSVGMQPLRSPAMSRKSSLSCFQLRYKRSFYHWRKWRHLESSSDDRSPYKRLHDEFCLRSA